MKKKIYLLALFVGLSIVLHAYLTPKYYQLNYAGGVQGESLCQVNETFDCTAVAASSYASLMGVPVSLWGMALNVSLFILLLGFLITDQKRQAWLAGLQALTLFSAGVSVVMGVISLTALSTYCLFCIFLYVLSFAQAALVFKLDPRYPHLLKNITSLFDFKAFPTGPYACLVLIPAIAFIGHNRMSTKYGGQRFEEQTHALIEDWKVKSPRPELENLNPLLEVKNAKASFEIIEFADFLCGHCKQASGVFKAFLKSHNAQYKFFVFPLDGTCRDMKSTASGPSCTLAKGTYCANQENLGWQAHDWFFENQQNLHLPGSQMKAKVTEMAKSIGIKDLEGFKSCLDKEETHRTIVEHAQLAQSLDVRGTPTIYANGKLLKGGQILSVLKQAYGLSVDK